MAGRLAMKVAIDARSLAPPLTGTGIALRETLRALRQLDPDDEYLLLASRPLEASAAEDGLPITMAPRLLRRAGSLFFRYGLGAALRNSGSQIHWATLQVGPRQKPPRTRVLLQMHDLVFRRFPETMARHNALIAKLWVEKSLEEADLIYCVSESTRREILDWKAFDQTRVRAVPNGVAPQFFVDPAHFDATAFRRTHALPKHYLLFVGTLEPRKNLLRLLKALPHIPALRSGEVKLVVLGGSGWRDRELERRLAAEIAAGRVQRYGYVEARDLPGFYAAAELFVSPSLYEGFGLPVLEAMAAGAPVLASRTAASYEVGGDVPVYFNPKNTEELAVCLAELLDDPARRANQSARGRTRAAKFSWERTARGVHALLRELS
ncbi:MAG: glycosyltransferase family 1 protein [Deltaproteobacteria bacterium]